MATKEYTVVTTEAEINAPVEKVWKYWTEPDHITQWSFASDDWHAPWAKNDLRIGGAFSSRMEAKDGSFGFDFGGVYDDVQVHKKIAYTMGDGRKVEATFSPDGGKTRVVQRFDAEEENSVEMQQMGWQAILNNFKKYVETK
ncbi:SRPBCC family protein [Pollutibacter soli]|uniref:SRPBCC family protein n=1 Tax=Pollutibacter soli TaxID=3034157 RepID=UPI003013E5A8